MKLFDGKLNEAAKLFYDNAKAHGFYDQEPTFMERMALVHAEISEAVEEYRKDGQVCSVWYSGTGKPEGVPIELADAIIRILDFAGRNGIDLEKAIEEKHAYNVSRPYKHGKIA